MLWFMASPDVFRDRNINFCKFRYTFWCQQESSLHSCAKILASKFPTGDRRQQWACWNQHCWIHISSERSSGNQIQQISSHGHPESLKGKHIYVVTVKRDWEGWKARDKGGVNRKEFQIPVTDVIHSSRFMTSLPVEDWVSGKCHT